MEGSFMNYSFPELVNALHESGPSFRISICIVLLHTVVTLFFFFYCLVFLLFQIINQKRLSTPHQWFGWTHPITGYTTQERHSHLCVSKAIL